MKGYKGFKKGLICLGKQYAENTVFEEAEAKVCESGMHFCENPFDVLDYYGFVSTDGTPNEFTEVEALDDPVTDDEKKFASKKLRIGAKLGIPGLIKAFVDYTMSNVDFANAKESNTGYRSAATNTGDRSAATNTGYQSAATNTGYQSAAAVEGRESFAIATGVEGMAKGKIGCYIAVAEWKWDNANKRYCLMDFQTRKVDGETIKEDVYYRLVNGEFVAQED